MLPAAPEPTGQSSPGAPALTFGRELRLRTAGEFRHVRETGKSRAGRFLVVNVAKPPLPRKGAAEDASQPVGPARFGFITSRKVGNAVTRNQVRRRLREIVRLHRPRLKPGVWVVTVARYSAARANYLALEQEWLRLARQLGILSDHSIKTEPKL